MMGVNHATTGAAAWIFLTASAPALTSGIYPVTPVGVFTGAIVCAGAALLPDADHHNGTIANSVPFFGRIAAKAIGDASGGHRHGLHSILGIIGVIIGSFLLDYVKVATEWFGVLPLGAGLATMALIAFAARALKLTKGGWWMPWLFGLFVASIIVFFSPTNLQWLPLAITVGYIVHLLGDAITTEGIAWFWPWKPNPPLWLQDVPVLNKIWRKSGYFSFPIIGNAGSIRETILGAACILYIVAALIYEAFWAFGLDIVQMMT